MKCTNCEAELEDGLEFCYFCGTSFSDAGDDGEEIENINTNILIEPEKKKDYSKKEQVVTETLDNIMSIYERESIIGKAIKVLSIIILVISVSLAIVLMLKNFEIGLAALLASLLISILAYGIGEIICLLTSINYRLK